MMQPGKTARRFWFMLQFKNFHVTLPDGLSLKCFMYGHRFEMYHLTSMQGLDSGLKQRNMGGFGWHDFFKKFLREEFQQLKYHLQKSLKPNIFHIKNIWNIRILQLKLVFYPANCI